ncbi:MAG: GNAT family N-acetyltransferase [Chloroflexi bacterium]|nr:GNAT family N-acetyltransferase [Chloroflexota bacterium]
MQSPSPSSVQMRPARPGDLEPLAELERLGFPLDQYSRKQLRYLLSHANASTYVMEGEGVIQAYAMVLWRRGSRVAHLYSIVTHPDFQGRGLGTTLLLQVEGEAVQHGCTRLRLEVRADNAIAIGLYQRRGYKLVKELPGFYTDDAPGLRLLKQLPRSAVRRR